MCKAREMLVEAAEALTGLLEWEREEGRRHVAADPQVVAGLSAMPGAPAGTAAGVAVPEGNEEGMRAIAERIAACRACPLHTTRTHTVAGEGSRHPRIVFVGEGPGAREDRTGRPFVGPAGAVLDRLIKRMGYRREDVWIGNIVKCRASEDQAMIKDRKPSTDEMAACLPFLREQLALLRPQVIVTLGATALEGLLGLRGISRYRGQWQAWEGLPVMPTYHPAFLLHTHGDKKRHFWEVWDDMTKVLERVGRSPAETTKTAPETDLKE